MKLRAIFFSLSIVWVTSLSPAKAGGSATNVTVSSQDLAAPGSPAQVLSVQAGPINPPYSYTLPGSVTVTDPTTFTLSGVWPLNNANLVLGQVTVGVYGQVVGSVSIASADRLNSGFVRIDEPYHIVFNTAGWGPTEYNNQTYFLPYLYLQQSSTSALATSSATTDTLATGVAAFGAASATESPIYQIPIPSGGGSPDAEVFSWPSADPAKGTQGYDPLSSTSPVTPALSTTSGIWAEWPDARLGTAGGNWLNTTFNPAAVPIPAGTLNAYTYWNPPNIATGVPVPSTWNAYAVLQNVNTSQYYATLVGSGNISFFPLETAAVYAGASPTPYAGFYANPTSSTTTPFSVSYPLAPAYKFVTSGTGTVLPTAISAKITNMYPYSRFFVRIFPPTSNSASTAPSTTPTIVQFGTPPNPLPNPYPPLYSVDNGTNNSISQAISSINLYNYVTQSGNYQVDLCEYTPVDTAAGTVYPQLASSVGASTITVPYGGTKTYAPGVKVIQSYYFYVTFSVNVNGVIVTQ
jgi:hypothetical protein